ncbi:FadR/GntR family transcriptional regulator [Nocardioides sp. zg-DK7169]|uniref:FadR/GntR family transcriptional regulator n=1 Tax=Nocardioides sp. zg-DK7169 TaxID=2736600 RepID=UPI001554E735|nr:FCD domain-containing protein [Nocardioides sp. zg-DK7169]NPC97683.1 FadR family transcriptional regulator [Nocardioides sp. zg-DK7169]
MAARSERGTAGDGPAYRTLADTLRAQILSGKLKSGDRLPAEPELCEMYGVSRSTVREALRALATEQLLVTRRGVAGGSFVAAPQPGDIAGLVQSSLALLTDADSVSVESLLEVREMLEVPAAGLAAARHAEEHLALLDETLFDPRGADPDVMFGANRDFHVGLLRAARNPVLEAVTAPIFGVVYERFVRRQAPEQFWTRVDHDHRDILDRVRAGDVAGAEEAQRAHLGGLRPTYERIDRERRATRD